MNKPKIQEIRKNIFHVSYETQYDLASAFMRLQEYYESPFEEFRGKFFKHEDYFDRYAESNTSKEFTYYTDWCGFNIPDKIFKEFYDLFKHDFWKKEKELFNAIIKMVEDKWNSGEKFYIIGSYKCSDQEDTIKHELAHAYWYMYPDTYRKGMSKFLLNKDIISNKQLRNVYKSLKKLGYNKEHFEDEAQAFLSTGKMYEIICKLRPGVEFKVPACIKKQYKDFDKKMAVK